jgi:phospholipid/cholesterol/gamma-HCH transport system permease protein
MSAIGARFESSAVGEAIGNTGEIVQFMLRVLKNIFTLKVFKFSGEIIRQSGLIIVSSGLVIVGMIFVIGLQCGIEGGYSTSAVGAPAYAAVFTAWCDLRELVPYVFGYMMAAKVGTGIVAELGAMRISEEIDALEVMGVDSLTFLCSTKMFASWLVLPFLYVTGVASGFFGSYIAVVDQLGQVSSGGYLQLFWQFQNPPDLLFSLTKAMLMATTIVLIGCYYGYNTSGGPVGVGTATAKSMAVNIVLVHLIGMILTQVFWGSNPRAPIGG